MISSDPKDTRDNNIAAPNRLETVDKLVDKNAFLIGDQGSHAVPSTFTG